MKTPSATEVLSVPANSRYAVRDDKGRWFHGFDLDENPLWGDRKGMYVFPPASNPSVTAWHHYDALKNAHPVCLARIDA